MAGATGQGVGLAIEGNGILTITGLFTGTGDFDPGVDNFNMTSDGGSDAFILRLNCEGEGEGEGEGCTFPLTTKGIRTQLGDLFLIGLALFGLVVVRGRSEK